VNEKSEGHRMMSESECGDRLRKGSSTTPSGDFLRESLRYQTVGDEKNDSCLHFRALGRV
jgi:hypothetical protein